MAFFGAHGRILARISAMVLAAAAAAPAASANSSPMVTGELTSQPIGHYEFCRSNPRECVIRSRNVQPEQMTDALRARIATVNVSVNQAIKPMSDLDIYGKDEVWTYPGEVGDCEDYVLLKRRMLVERGMALANLLITVVRKPDGEGHAVLTVRTDRGDFVLDNLNNAVRPWEQTGYRYLKRQSAEHTGRWVAIHEGHTTLVGSLD
jgi:predicted transglutaminase-like cysteine proteinase